MSEDLLYRSLYALGTGIDTCISNVEILPALVLTYAAIDTVGWLASDDEFATRRSFVDWADRYLVPSPKLKCTAVELYAARCGLLHTFSPNSKLTAEGAARRICYAWGTASTSTLDQVIDSVDYGENLVSLHVEDLYSAWLDGIESFLADLDRTPERRAAVHAKADGFYSPLGVDDPTS